MDLAKLVNLLEGVMIYKLIGSILLVILVLVSRTLLTRAVLRMMAKSEMRRNWIVSIRNGLVLVLILGLVSIWADVLREFALSVVAVAVAFVIATRELILCLNGSAVRAATNAFSVGDRIEVGSHRGDVIDLNLLTTTLLEVGPGRSHHLRTGRAITIPNSLLLNMTVINESYMEPFVLHMFSIPLKVGQDWRKAEEIVLESASAECRPYFQEAKEYMERLGQSQGLDSSSVEPRVSLQMLDAENLSLQVRVPAPVGRQGRVEQAILRKFLDEFGMTPKEIRQEDSGNRTQT